MLIKTPQRTAPLLVRKHAFSSSGRICLRRHPPLTFAKGILNAFKTCTQVLHPARP
jgi:hypothetical protein